VTEKLFQTLAAGTIPLYHRVPGLDSFLPRGTRWLEFQGMSSKQLVDQVRHVQESPLHLLEYHTGWEIGDFAWEFENQGSEIGRACGQDFRCSVCDWVLEHEHQLREP
jgi:hypothetical protein